MGLEGAGWGRGMADESADTGRWHHYRGAAPGTRPLGYKIEYCFRYYAGKTRPDGIPYTPGGFLTFLRDVKGEQGYTKYYLSKLKNKPEGPRGPGLTIMGYYAEFFHVKLEVFLRDFIWDDAYLRQQLDEHEEVLDRAMRLMEVLRESTEHPRVAAARLAEALGPDALTRSFQAVVEHHHATYGIPGQSPVASPPAEPATRGEDDERDHAHPSR